MARAAASHILVKTEQEALDLKRQIEEQGADFGALAKKHSSCPSGRQGGALGEFGRGDMVPEFDRVVFGDLPVGQVSEPVKTQFGYHLVRVDRRIG
jgi:peptidyl-prolyl cis-trans isomerase C